MLNPMLMTGLQYLQALGRGEFPPATIAKTIPMVAVSATHGEVVFHATANDQLLNPLGGVHGGFAATVLDSVTGCAVHTTLAAGEGYGTTDLNIKMCRPVPVNVQLITTGRVINAGKNLVIAEGALKDTEGKLYAHATATCMVIRPPKV